MKFQILDNNRIQFFNSNGQVTGELFVSESADMFLRPLSASGDLILGNDDVVGSVEIGNPNIQSTLKLMGGGIISANGGSLTLGDPATNDTVIINTMSLNINGTRRTLYTTASIAYAGSNISSVTQSFANGTVQKTAINYSGDNPISVVVSGSDNVNKVYTLSYDGSNVTQITVT